MIGFKVYYEKQTENVILTIPENHNEYAKETTKEQDFQMFSVLQARDKDSVDFIQLDYGQHRRDFESANSWRVNLKTKVLEFSYPQYNPPLASQVESLENENADLKGRIAELEQENTNLILAIAEMAESNALEKAEVQLAIAELAEVISNG